MTWWMESDALYDSPNMQRISAEGNHLRVMMCGYVGRQMRAVPDYDRTFNLKNMQAVTLNAATTPSTARLRKLAAELVDAGAWSREGDDRWKIVEAEPFGKFAGGAELSAKRAAAGSKGGRASGRARRSKPEATDEANHRSKPEAIASRLLQANDKQTRSDTDTYTEPINPPGPPQAEAEATGPVSSLTKFEHRLDTRTADMVRSRYPGRLGRKADYQPAIAAALMDTDPQTLYGAVVNYDRAIQAGDVLRRDTPTLGEWLTSQQWRRWQPNKPRTYEWGGISRQWLHQHITSQVPDGTFTDSVEQGFWAQVKTGMDASQVAQDIVNHLNRRATATTSAQA